ncbi:MAG: MerR family transcriptional regulator [Candidatus Sumerlaeaceae bacterium]|nr:MerR family transcriptional regulator [Candidatus Sumerlaeaceae bacterium]
MYGLNPNTLRTWERRYNLIHPLRSDGGHRVYGERDLSCIEMMVKLMAGGLSPAQAATETKKSVPATPAKPAQSLGDHRQRLRSAVQNLDSASASRICHEIVDELGYKSAIEQVLFPELDYWGHKWEISSAHAIAHEHVATLAVRSVITMQSHAVLQQSTGLPVVLACAPGEEHDLPLLHVANLLHESKLVHPSVFVSGLPIADILAAAEKCHAKAVVISATIRPRPAIVREWADEIVRRQWEERTILVGPGFTRSRIFSETRIKAAPGNYSQVLILLSRMLRLGENH